MSVPPSTELAFVRWQLEQVTNENRELKECVEHTTEWYGVIGRTFAKMGMHQEANGCRLLGIQVQEMVRRYKERQAAG